MLGDWTYPVQGTPRLLLQRGGLSASSSRPDIDSTWILPWCGPPPQVKPATISRARPARRLAALQLVGIEPQLRLVFERPRLSTGQTIRSHLARHPGGRTLKAVQLPFLVRTKAIKRLLPTGGASACSQPYAVRRSDDSG